MGPVFLSMNRLAVNDTGHPEWVACVVYCEKGGFIAPVEPQEPEDAALLRLAAAEPRAAWAWALPASSMAR
jgi:hypothetical protein